MCTQVIPKSYTGRFYSSIVSSIHRTCGPSHSERGSAWSPALSWQVVTPVGVSREHTITFLIKVNREEVAAMDTY